ncbi:protein ARV1-like isoform X2 [Mizuhopecten yessoensis]|uniref:protein ARV1-like isoform X2 n=1 Tax=Mizuhopecten yessoensis TaxID=6573 RepID=UPI000B459D4E|nr:protein ARV1-like isoform X2 [Mizuhopecten yessoensis]
MSGDGARENTILTLILSELFAKHCQKVVDKYIESEPVIICLDFLLLKQQAFRHVLYNRKTQGHWKLVAILLLCDAFTKLLLGRPHSTESYLRPDYMIYSALEWGLYINFSLALIELFITILIIIVCIRTISTEKCRPGELMRGVLLSNFGKILVIPAVLWGTNYSLIYVSLSRMFVCAANIQAIRVLSPGCHVSTCIMSVVLGHVVAMLSSIWIQNILSQVPG